MHLFCRFYFSRSIFESDWLVVITFCCCWQTKIYFYVPQIDCAKIHFYGGQSSTNCYLSQPYSSSHTLIFPFLSYYYYYWAIIISIFFFVIDFPSVFFPSFRCHFVPYNTLTAVEWISFRNWIKSTSRFSPDFNLISSVKCFFVSIDFGFNVNVVLWKIRTEVSWH